VKILNKKVKSAGIIGIGSSVPEKTLTNKDLEKMVDTSDEWILKRTGISERRVLGKEEPASALAIKAAINAMKSSGIDASEIDLIIVTTDTPDYLTPATACMVQGAIGAVKAAAFDLNAACSGIVYGMTVAEQFIKNGYYKYVLVIACEGLTKVVDWEDRNTCVLFGDGAGAVMMGPVEDGYGILSSEIGADGSSCKLITVPCCAITEDDLQKRAHENKRVLWMNGKEVFKFAVTIMPEATMRVMEKAKLKLEDIKLIIPHQANKRIIEGAIKRLQISKEKVYTCVQKYGNISSASIPVALDEIVKACKIKKGDNIVLVGFGGGLTWAATIVKWSMNG
jgi:3-oxoacyl-[acyl-carrier-protein] synthase-3